MSRSVVWAILAHSLLAAALLLSDGIDYGAMGIVGVVCVVLSAICVGIGLRGATRGEMAPPGLVLKLTWATAMGSTLAGFVRRPGEFASTLYGSPFYPATTLAAACLVASYAPAVLARETQEQRGSLARLRPLAMGAAALGLGAWMLRASPAPFIDVWMIHAQGAEALLHGRSVYEPGVVSVIDTFTDQRVIDTYMYPPVNALLTTAAYAITHETRWAVLVAVLLTAYLLHRAARLAVGPRSLWPDLLVACLLFHPRGLFVLEHSWGDPLALPFLGGFVVAAMERRRLLAAVSLGLLAASKQHLVLFLPALVLVPGVGLWGLGVALLTLTATYVPFLVTSARGMWEGLIEHHLHNPFRRDSMSVTALFGDAGVFLPAWVGMLATLASFGVLRWIPRRLGPLLLSCALSFLVFYALGRQAFCNYYYALSAVLLFAAVDLGGPSPAHLTVQARQGTEPG